MKKLFCNGHIYTMNQGKTCSAFLVEDGVICATDEEAMASMGAQDVDVIDLGGKTVLPGFHDSHMHFLNYAIDKKKVDFFQAKSIEDMAKIVKEYIETVGVKAGEWIQGGGWNEIFFAEKKIPTLRQLDAMCPNNPVIFTRACCSVAVANTAALKLAGIYDAPPQMEDGCIVVDDAGVPTGLLEERARFLIYNIIPNISEEDIKTLIAESQEDLLACGLTTVQTDDFKLWDATENQILNAYREMDESGALKVRFHQQLRLIDHAQLDDFLQRGLKTGDGTAHFKIGAFKLLPDGSLGGKTAALREPYEGEESHCGILTYDFDTFYGLLEKAHQNHLQLAMHAIGDKTMDVVLDCYEKLMEKYPAEDPRYRIIHCQITTKDILERFARLNIVADIQPLFIRSDMEIAEALLGSERTKWSYNWKTMTDMGIHTSGSSDAPVEPFTPLLAIYCAVTSKNLEGNPKDGWMPEQRLTREEAVALYTTGAAYTVFEESYKGKLEKGYLADFIVLSDDIFTVPEDDILNLKIEKTFVNGDLVYQQ